MLPLMVSIPILLALFFIKEEGLEGKGEIKGEIINFWKNPEKLRRLVKAIISFLITLGINYIWSKENGTSFSYSIFSFVCFLSVWIGLEMLEKHIFKLKG